MSSGMSPSSPERNTTQKLVDQMTIHQLLKQAMKAHNATVRDLEAKLVEKSRKAEDPKTQGCTTCPVVQASIAAISEAYQKTIEEKDRTIRKLEEEVAALTKSPNGKKMTLLKLNWESTKRTRSSDISPNAPKKRHKHLPAEYNQNEIENIESHSQNSQNKAEITKHLRTESSQRSKENSQKSMESSQTPSEKSEKSSTESSGDAITKLNRKILQSIDKAQTNPALVLDTCVDIGRRKKTPTKSRKFPALMVPETMDVNVDMDMDEEESTLSQALDCLDCETEPPRLKTSPQNHVNARSFKTTTSRNHNLKSPSKKSRLKFHEMYSSDISTSPNSNCETENSVVEPIKTMNLNINEISNCERNNIKSPKNNIKSALAKSNIKSPLAKNKIQSPFRKSLNQKIEEQIANEKMNSPPMKKKSNMSFTNIEPIHLNDDKIEDCDEGIKRGKVESVEEIYDDYDDDHDVISSSPSLLKEIDTKIVGKNVTKMKRLKLKGRNINSKGDNLILIDSDSELTNSQERLSGKTKGDHLSKSKRDDSCNDLKQSTLTQKFSNFTKKVDKKSEKLKTTSGKNVMESKNKTTEFKTSTQKFTHNEMKNEFIFVAPKNLNNQIPDISSDETLPPQSYSEFRYPSTPTQKNHHRKISKNATLDPDFHLSQFSMIDKNCERSQIDDDEILQMLDDDDDDVNDVLTQKTQNKSFVFKSKVTSKDVEDDCVYDLEDQEEDEEEMPPVSPPINDSFDRVPKKAIPDFAHVEVVKKKGERRQLPAHDCGECKQYYSTMNLSDSALAAKLQSCSRHRARYVPPTTPEDFWKIGFPTTQEIVRKGYTKTDTQPGPSKFRRKRKLMKHFTTERDDQNDQCSPSNNGKQVLDFT